MKLVIKVGYARDAALGRNRVGCTVETVEESDAKRLRVRAANMDVRIADYVREGMGKLLADELCYVGYVITWKTQQVSQDQETGVAILDDKMKNNCPPEIRDLGRRLVAELRNSAA